MNIILEYVLVACAPHFVTTSKLSLPLVKAFMDDVNLMSTKKRAILLSSSGAKVYQLLRGLSNNDPTSNSYDQLVQLMRDHLYPPPNSIAERFKFNTRDRQPSETIAQYVAVLCQLS